MLHIIGLVLKCIGILLAVLLGVIILLLGILLFVPLRYEGKADFPGKTEEITGQAKMTWFFHLIRADVLWKDGELSWKVRAAWKVLGGEASERKAADVAEKTVEEAAEVHTPETVTQGAKRVSEEKKTASSKPDSEKKTESSSTKNQTVQGLNKKRKETFLERIKKKFQKFLEWIKCTFCKICDKIKEGTELKDRILTFLQDETHKGAYARVKKEFIWLKRFFKVKKGHITLRFGFDDPSLTGKILGILGMLYPLVNGNLYVTPEFEEECLEGQIDLKGQMRLIHLVIFVIRLVLDKHVRQTYKDVIEWKDS